MTATDDGHVADALIESIDRRVAAFDADAGHEAGTGGEPAAEPIVETTEPSR